MTSSIVFHSDIIREKKTTINHLYELLEVTPAKPLPKDDSNTTTTCNFVPKTDKQYVSNKKSKLKVKTVRYLREQLEKAVYAELNVEMEKHKSNLLRKIRIGSSRNEATIKLAKSILRSDSPVCKDVWQMLTNLNPEGHSHSAQFVRWNHKSIQINGSRGGKTKFICHYDVGDNINSLNKSFAKSSGITYKRKMLNNSLNVKFRPGPLSMKKHLDNSYQKYQYGDCTLLRLPKPGLDVQPLYGTPLSCTMINFLSENFMRNADGKVTEKWAEFSLSTLGVNKRGNAVQSEKGKCVPFDLEYKCNQSSILMRDNNKSEPLSIEAESSSLEADINIVLNKILDYVEIKLEEENLSKDDRVKCLSVCEKVDITSKDKNKRKFCELDRLDVTVIKLSSAETEGTKCEKDSCSLGCVCSSLECSYNLKTHCGRIDCMFVCKCVNTKRCAQLSHDSHTFSGIEDLNKKLNSGLAKEEQKFRQTVILSGEKSIMMKSERRNWKSSKRYADFYSNMCLKSETETKKQLLILIPKLPCDNIEPWCMVHNLYKCFCKGKFTERKSNVHELSETSDQVTDVSQPTDIKFVDDIPPELPRTRSSIRINDNKQDDSDKIIESNDNEAETSLQETFIECLEDFECARAKPYNGRKHSNEYYLETNSKIFEMEKNDRKLLKRMKKLMNIKNEEPEQEVPLKNNERTSNETKSFSNIAKDFFEKLPYNPKMVAWIIACYKHCKKCKSQGKIEKVLKPPRFMRIGFYTWEFILSRYRDTKNFFLVTPDKPHKIFVAINQNHPKLKSYINIKDLSLDAVQNYPDEVQNLRTNAITKEDKFWILRGLTFCWEFYGVVKKKITEHMEDEDIVCSLRCDEQEPLEVGKGPLSICYGFSDDEPEDSNSNSVCIDVENCQDLVSKRNEVLIIDDKPETNETKINENVTNNKTKWYLMIVEDDFNELHFFKKGFFVQYEHIVQAINVSQSTKKTVKLYCQKKSENNEEIIHFGIYAIPNDNRNVVIGPYEPDEPLGIEIVRTSDGSAVTRGMFITISRCDITKLIDDPLSFIPPRIRSCNMTPLEAEASIRIKNNRDDTRSHPDNITPTKSIEDNTIKTEFQPKVSHISKPIKPIKIRKSDGFYCVPNFLNSHEKSGLAIIPKSCLSKTLPIQQKFVAGVVGPQAQTSKPVAEIAPQVKTDQIPTKNTFKGVMSVLKPEEINKRIMEKMPAPSDDLYGDVDKDIENFLATASVCTLHDDDVYIISDEETGDEVKNVWIQSKSVPSLGCIPAKVNADDHISFEFPGFKYTDFYCKEEAFRKINLVLSRKVYIPKKVEIEWEIVEDDKGVTFKKLEDSDLDADLILTKHGLKKRADVIKKIKSKRNLDIDTVDAIEMKKTKLEIEPHSEYLEMDTQ